MNNEQFHRIVVVGTSCSGKSTFARALAGRLGQAHVELDELYWGPGWTPRPKEEFREAVTRAVAGARWVVDGNYSVARDIVWGRATCVVWLNYSFGVVMSRAIRRTWRRCWRREKLFAGNQETFRIQLLSRDSILWWVITTHGERKREYEKLRASGEFKGEWVEFRRPGEAEGWIVQYVA